MVGLIVDFWRKKI